MAVWSSPFLEVSGLFTEALNPKRYLGGFQGLGFLGV